MEQGTEDRMVTVIERARDLARESLDLLMAELEHGRSEALEKLLRALGTFHSYSLANTMLIVSQRPTATRVAGYRAWQKIGRQVRRGEKGIVIMAPMRHHEENGAKADEVRGFRAARVFDIAQTDGEPLPHLEVTRGDPGRHRARLHDFARLHAITVEYSDAMGGADGASCGGRIVLRRDIDAAGEFATLVHELAHELLHQGTPVVKRPPLSVRETEAEAVSFAVSNAVGLEVTGAARDYIQLYRGDAALLRASLERVKRVATTMIGYLLDEPKTLTNAAA